MCKTSYGCMPVMCVNDTWGYEGISNGCIPLMFLLHTNNSSPHSYDCLIRIMQLLLSQDTSMFLGHMEIYLPKLKVASIVQIA